MRPIVILVLWLAFFSSRVQSSNLMQVLKSQSPVHLGGRVHTAYIRWPTGKWIQETNWELGGKGNDQRVVMLNVAQVVDKWGYRVLTGKMQYSGESKQRDFNGRQFPDDVVTDRRRWMVNTGFDTPDVNDQFYMDFDGRWIMGGRTTQRLVMLNLFSIDNGLSMYGTISYDNEGPLEFRTAL